MTETLICGSRGNKAAGQNEGGRQERLPTSTQLTRRGGPTHSIHGVPKQPLRVPVSVRTEDGNLWKPQPPSLSLSTTRLSKALPTERSEKLGSMT